MGFKIGQILFWPFFLLSCSKKPSDLRLSDQERLYSQGKKVYMTSCVACHNPDPKVDGSIGPANYGSSLELLRLKVVKGGYPTGYHPKRSTQLMPPFEEHAKDIEALHVFLNQ